MNRGGQISAAAGLALFTMATVCIPAIALAGVAAGAGLTLAGRFDRALGITCPVLRLSRTYRRARGGR